mmetsp:Transcript_58430/g.169495  ORF Transcript_58430/g.169495 Transcript_58430/m.169495 type:complete len:202 (-) Transcript_58430:1936-2541(-)
MNLQIFEQRSHLGLQEHIVEHFPRDLAAVLEVHIDDLVADRLLPGHGPAPGQVAEQAAEAFGRSRCHLGLDDWAPQGALAAELEDELLNAIEDAVALLLRRHLALLPRSLHDVLDKRRCDQIKDAEYHEDHDDGVRYEEPRSVNLVQMRHDRTAVGQIAVRGEATEHHEHRPWHGAEQNRAIHVVHVNPVLADRFPQNDAQ